MIHGNHWVATFPKLIKEVEKFTDFLMDIVAKGKLITRSNLIKDDDEIRYVISNEHEPLIICCLIKKETHGQTNWDFANAFPILNYGIPYNLQILTLAEDEDNDWTFDLQIDNERNLKVFVPCFRTNQMKDYINSKKEFYLSALAYFMKKSEVLLVEANQHEFVEDYKKSLLEDNPKTDVSEISFVPISLDGAIILIDQDNNDYSFRFKIEEVCEIYQNNNKFFILTGLGYGEDFVFKIPLMVNADNLDGYYPVAGDNVEGVCWIQGRIK